MANSVALIDYGAGNLHSVHNALKAVGANVTVTNSADTVLQADRLVLPGVGSFRACADGLRSLPGMVEALETRVLSDAVPFLGICVGMQLLATRGLEHETSAGLDWISGEVRLIESNNAAIKVPHMGWNDVRVEGDAPVIRQGEAYFLHSYHLVPDASEHIAAQTTHGAPLCAAVHKNNILGVQFHPEKSQRFGLDLLARFLEWQP